MQSAGPKVRKVRGGTVSPSARNWLEPTRLMVRPSFAHWRTHHRPRFHRTRAPAATSPCWLPRSSLNGQSAATPLISRSSTTDGQIVAADRGTSGSQTSLAPSAASGSLGIGTHVDLDVRCVDQRSESGRPCCPKVSSPASVQVNSPLIRFETQWRAVRTTFGATSAPVQEFVTRHWHRGSSP